MELDGFDQAAHKSTSFRDGCSHSMINAPSLPVRQTMESPERRAATWVSAGTTAGECAPSGRRFRAIPARGVINDAQGTMALISRWGMVASVRVAVGRWCNDRRLIAPAGIAGMSLAVRFCIACVAADRRRFFGDIDGPPRDGGINCRLARVSACPGKACPCEGEGGHRFSERDMRQREKVERIPFHSNAMRSSSRKKIKLAD